MPTACLSLPFAEVDPIVRRLPFAVRLQLPADELPRRWSEARSRAALRLESNMPDVIEKLGGSVMNLILGALIVWVGQTTYQHAGVLAGLDDKFVNIDDNFAAVDKRYEGLRKWLENVVTDMKDTNRLQFTAKEGDKVVGQIRKVEDSTVDLERKVIERLNQLELKIVALQTAGQNSQQVAALQTEVAQLRFAMTQTPATPEARYPSATSVSQQPVYLPPVSSRR
jgi:hypothetical protein